MNKYKVEVESKIKDKKGVTWRIVTLDRAPSLRESHGKDQKVIIDGKEYVSAFWYDADALFSIRDYEGPLLGKTIQFKQ